MPKNVEGFDAGVTAEQRYRGKIARGYDDHRLSQPKWSIEQDVVERMLKSLAPGTTILDVPVGTGRFFEFYKALDLRPTGVDVSADMIAEAQRKADEIGLSVTFKVGAIQKLPVAHSSFDVALCIRLMNLVDFSVVKRAIGELARTSRGTVIIGIRHYEPFGRIARKPSRLLGQLWFRLRRMTGQNSFIVHRRADIFAAFGRHRLSVVEAATIERSGNGTELVIYHLRQV